jgi:hypothetical protein
VFADLGAGVGKVALAAAMTTVVGTSLGVELSQRRFELGMRALAEARRLEIEGAERVELRHADMLTTDLESATVVYTCSTAFSESFMRRLVRRVDELPTLRKLVSLQSIDDHPRFELVEVYRLDASWRRRTPVHVYTRRTH